MTALFTPLFGTALVIGDGIRALLTLGRITFAAALALFVVVLFFLLRRDSGS